jgi:fatty acid desaturase
MLLGDRRSLRRTLRYISLEARHETEGGGRTTIDGTNRTQEAHTASQVLKLCGPEILTVPVVLGVVGLQFFCAYALRNTAFLSWQTFVTAYVIGATANQNLFLAIHEISHNLAFKSPFANRMLAIFANLPIGIPYSASFRVCSDTYLR